MTSDDRKEKPLASSDWSLGSLHDAEIVAVSVDRWTKIARLDFRLEEGGARSILLSGIRAFRCTDLSLQNVVYEVLQSDGMTLKPSDVDSWLTWITWSPDGPSWLLPDRRESWSQALRAATLKLVVFLPSVGAMAAGICEEVHKVSH